MIRITTTTAGLLAVIALAPSLHGGDLASSVQTALTQSPEAQSAAFQKEAAFQEKLEAKGAFAPKATLTGSAGPGLRDRSSEGIASDGDWLTSRELRLRITQPVFDGGGRRSLYKAAHWREIASEFDEKDRQTALALGVVEAYFGILRARELIRVAEANVSDHRNILGRTRKSEEAGEGGTDSSLVNGRLGLAQSLLESRRVALEQAKVRYLHFVGEQPTDLRVPGYAKSLPTSYDSIDFSQNYAVQAARSEADALTAEAEAEKARYKPRIDLAVTGGIGEDVQGIRGEDNEFSALVVGSWDLFDRTRKPAVKKLQARANARAALADETLLQANERAGLAWADLQGARRQVRVLGSYVGEIGNVVSDYDDQFDVGQRSLLNVLDIRNERFRARSALVEASLLQRVSEYRLLAATGDLLDEFSATSGKEVVAK